MKKSARKMLGVPCPLQGTGPRACQVSASHRHAVDFQGDLGKQRDHIFSTSPSPAFLGPSFRWPLARRDPCSVWGCPQALRGDATQ